VITAISSELSNFGHFQSMTAVAQSLERLEPNVRTQTHQGEAKLPPPDAFAVER
jgi:hypothetical protein